MEEITACTAMSVPGLVLSDKIPISLISYMLEHKEVRKKFHLTFFGSVYHATFPIESGPSIGVFVQFNNGAIQDIFCQCEASQEAGVCPHIAETVRAIFSTSTRALHERFLSSPYYQLFQALPLSKKRPEFMESKQEIRIPTGTKFVSVEARAKGDELFSFLNMLEMEEDTEESSIKFAHLSEEDLTSWYQGNPSPRLAFELSSLGDLARFLFLKEEMEKKPSWHMDGKGRLVCSWDDLSVSLPYPEGVSLEAFRHCKGTELFHGCSMVKCSYVKERVVFHVQGSLLNKKKPVWRQEKDRVVQEWPVKCTYTPASLDEQEALLEACFLDTTPQAVTWSLHLSDKGLHGTARVLGQEGVAFVGRWFITKAGDFIPTCGTVFSKTDFFIPHKELGTWLKEHRDVLSLFSGFRVHDKAFSHDVAYQLSSQGMLTFSRKTKGKRERFSTFGSYIFVPEKGFFLEEELRHQELFGQAVLPHRIAEFIRAHRQELSSLDGFFAEQSPIASVNLSIRQEKKSVVFVEPTIVWKKPAYERELSTFEEFGYLPGVGFFELPQSLSLAREVHRSNTEAWNLFFEKELPLLKLQDECRIDPLLEGPKSLQLMCNRLDPEQISEVDVPIDQVWNADFFWKSPLGHASLEEVVSAKRRGERWVITDAGTLFLLESRFEWLLLVMPPVSKKNKGMPSRVKTWDFLKIQAHDEVQFTVPIDSGPRSLVEKLLHDRPVEALPDLSLLQCSLRSYQMAGLEWLWMLYSFGLSGLLCDDMGVGKTHQAMGLLAAVKTHLEKKGVHRPFLVICPTSLIWHWKEKIAQFLPSFKLFSYLGHDRTLESFCEGTHDLFLTTYGILRNECQTISKFHFEVAIFDELQIAKNHCSRIWAALSQISSTMRLGLTGTPIENQLRELKALFDLLVPGYLPEEALFRELYVRPYEKHGLSDERFCALTRYVKPFILRRKKAEVLRDLPEKVEEKYRVELLDEQRELYKQVASHQVGTLIQQLRDESVPIPYIHIFALLSSLKQICNHPAAYLKEVEQYEQYGSAKWDAFQELLEEAIESGQKVVVFSQFLSMLDIMKLYLTKRKIGFAEIRGRTKDRGDEMKRFHKDPACQVFLGSLQAAGLGIDLTAATVVIHYDRWWNAARENQATDRVHRIGQERGVQVCKLITLGTIEERIDQMIERKAQLLEGVIAYDDHQVVKKLTRGELLELVQDICSS